MGCYAVSVARASFGEPVAAHGQLDVDPATGVDSRPPRSSSSPAAARALVSCSFKAGGQGFYQVIGTEGMIDVPRAFIPGMGSRVAEGLGDRRPTPTGGGARRPSGRRTITG